MIIDLFHNKLVKDTATDAFVASFNSLLVPMVVDKYGDSIEAITMYEDYLADDLFYEGAWHYPLSVKRKGDDAIILWVKWPVSKKTFRNNVPYAYVGKESVDFSFADYVPEEFAAKLQGRAIDYDRKALKISVEAVTDDPLILVGKYSQTFVDELARQITKDISATLGVEGFENTTMELQLVFAPGTYLEHASENVTYRRLLLTEKSCQARDFWVKWTRLGGNGGFRMTEHANAENVQFKIGEDASQKIREKEYRFLAGANPNKYQAAMGKKTVTEWRDIIKRALKREELVKVVTEKELATHADDVFNVFSAIQSAAAKSTEHEQHVPVVESAVKDPYDVVAALSEQLNNPITETETKHDDSNDDIAALVRATLGNVAAKTADVTDEAEEEQPDTALEDESTDTAEAIEVAAEGDDTADSDDTAKTDDDVVEPVFTPISAMPDAFALAEEEEDDAFTFAGGDDEGEEFTMGEVTFEEYERTVAKAQPTAPAVDTEALAREKEAQLRLVQETEARLKAEQERENLRLERERLLAENARLIKLAKEEEDRRIREEEARRLAEEERKKQFAQQKAEEERMRLELEARKRREEQERFRFAETARMAVEEQKRIEAERQAKIEREKQEALAREAERLRMQEEARRLEEERMREERRQREEEARRLAEEESQRRAEAAKARVQIVDKRVNLVFRSAYDPNILPRIKEIIVQTIESLGKSGANIRVGLGKGDFNMLVLEFKMPSDEIDMLVHIGKAIGNARIGVIKVSIE